MSRLGRIGRALQHRNYRLFFGGQLVSLIGTWMQSVAQSWLVYRLTGSTVLLGIVGFCSQIPVFLLAPIGGMVADRLRRHRVIVATQTTMMLLAFVLSALTLSGRVHVAHVMVLAFGLGVANAFDIPARQSFVVELVGRDYLANAIALNSSMVTGARIVGPALAGVTLAALGEGWCFFANGVSFVAVLAGLLAMRDLQAAPRAKVDGSPLAHVGEGFAYAGRTAPVRAILLLLGLSSLMGAPYATLMPAIAAGVLKHGAHGFGMLMSAAGTGALLGALTLASREGLSGLGRWLAAAAALFGASLVAFSFSRSFWLSIALLVPIGYGYMVQMAASNTLVQSMTPDAMRGRVMAVYAMMFMGMSPIGALLAGALAARIGPMRTVLAGGLCTLVGAAIFSARLPLLRASAREVLGALPPIGGDGGASGGA